MALRRLESNSKTLPETVNDDDKNVSFYQKLKRNARTNAKDSRKTFVHWSVYRMFRRTVNDGEVLPTHEEKLTLFERMERDIAEKERSGKSTNTVFRLIVVIMIFQSTTELYASMHYIVPYVFQNYSPWTIYYMNVLIWFVVMNMLANWLCVMLYSSVYPKTKDNPHLPLEQQDASLPDQFAARIEQASSQNGANGHCVYEMSTKEALPWSFCEKCSMHVPYRAHHCDFCKACILKRDHHCYMVGTCIGFKNQRYWIILTFYVAVNCILCGIFVLKYVRNEVWPDMSSWTDLVFPLTIWRSLFGNIPSLHCILILQLYVDFVFGLLSFSYFNIQMFISVDGKTLYEVNKKIPVRNTNGFNKNMKSVFGDFWALNFLFPMILIFRQRDDGIHWDGIKINKNAKGQIRKPENMYSRQ